MPKESHQCLFCGEWVTNGKDTRDERHWLSDCRPDLVEHEPGKTCTWFGMTDGNEQNCYAYQDKDRNWTKEHKHFYPDGPM